MEHSTLGQVLPITNATIAGIRFATQASGNYLAQMPAANEEKKEGKKPGRRASAASAAK